MTTTETSNVVWRISVTAALIVVLIGLLVAAAHAEDASRLDRKLRVMERVVDEVLLQSHHVVVSPGRVAHGLYLEEYGVVLSFEGSLGDGMWALGVAEPQLKFLQQLREREDEGDEEEKDLPLPADVGKWREASAKRDREAVDALKKELVDALLDYGPTLTELRDDQWLALAAFLDGNELLGGDEGTRLLLKVRMRDLRQAATGSLSRDAAKAKVVVEER